MKALLYSSLPPHSMSFSDIPVPSASPGKLLIKVHAAAINPVDYKLASMPVVGWFKRGSGVGLDFSGTVEAVPKDHSGPFKLGDEVYGNSTGTLAEYCLADPGEISGKPKGMGHAEAASLVTAGLTSLQALQTGGTKSGSNVLVIGASGGCGSTGVQIAKALGAKVTGICGTSSIDFVKSLGADEVIDYNDKTALDALKGARFDVIYDTVTSPEDTDYSFLKPALKSDARWVAINGFASDWARKLLPLIGERANYNLITTRHDGADLETLARMVEDGKLKAVVAGTYKLEEKDVWEAFEKLKSRRTKGKQVVLC
jgi:NADPH:quinone reductase-like Zn-dependent oxidoreductase